MVLTTSARGGGGDRAPSRRQGCGLAPAGAAALLAGASCLCYGRSLQGEFVHDDVWAIVNNPDVRPGAPLRWSIFTNDFWGKGMAENTSHKSYRPLCVLTFKLNIFLTGMNPFYFHAVNVILHCLVTLVLMYTCDKTVFKNRGLAFVTALLFAVHPIHTEAVAGIVGRADVLACLLFLLAFLSYNRSLDQGCVGESFPSTVSPFFLLFSLFLGTCAMLVKETGITVFGVCLVYDLFSLSNKEDKSYLRASSNRNFLLTMRPFLKRAILVLSYVLVILYFRLWIMGGSMPLFSEQDNPASFSPYILTRFLTYSYLLAFNVWLLLAPVTLCYDWQVGSIPLVETIWDMRNLATILLAVVMALLSLHCLAAFKRLEHKEVLVGLLFLVFPFIPASNLFFRVGFVVAERVLYMPSMGYCILFVHGLSKLCTWLNRCGATTLIVSTVLLLLLFSWKTVKQNEIWLSRESLFRSGVQTLPHNAKVHYNYANFLKDQGRNKEAIYHYRTALKLYPRHASALNNLGTLIRDTAEAKMYYQKALQLHPQHNRALFNLGNLLKSQEKKEEAITLLKDSIKYGPEFADAYSSLASLLAEQERFKEAEEIYQAGIKNCPDSSDLHNNYGVFLVDTGLPEKAVAHYQQAIKLSPSHHVAMVNLGRLYRSLGENSMAEEWYKRALQVAHKAEILSPLGALYYNTGRYEEALQIYQEAAALQPSQRELRLALAQVLAVMGQTKEAEKMTNHIVSEETGCLECYRLLSAIYSKQENHDKALDVIEKALQLKPKDPKVISELFFTKGNQLREQNLLDKAFESYRVAVQLNPDQAQAWMNMGGIQHIKGKYVSARAYYERALQLVPDSKLLKENLAKLDRLEKRLQEVREKDQT
ncbi:protein O-mannosyl-transferase TMTC1 isoform X3 [Macaca thibetana thibetana]|uniref:Protein O-mannosyl-transferase TMTC1 n=1 Tax=Macaca fascicularis TaxID=9541 RepID=A0A7N9IGR0_MACFA|nr:protein O-mannosyl-transferase TMTC1 isoform X5 [Macaca fascicularis]XP_011743802.1 transmembrane and TPR repeat-containing protein 1 isoform X4 [Macaca nemestrina]XP_015006836.1 protein O-mannosyl-transferase TMTC1 isoform X3 [Macaca mulatta]XP_050604475.1 protein O-mannosyl-transferase TMTC1 isoform X3 [Macaca thibetana thibetana]